MPKWKEGETEFTVSITYNERRGYQVNMPRPIVKKLGQPKKVKFSIKGSKIEVSASE
ncbi:MAG: hypothetical protein M1587_06830 [Thaumarchaeota archaeon]|nr:hypothetical protein [Nitrososphaerota archaeon]MDG6997143.1 hypothetical protein [Nitrososphaerota archaeon]